MSTYRIRNEFTICKWKINFLLITLLILGFNFKANGQRNKKETYNKAISINSGYVHNFYLNELKDRVSDFTYIAAPIALEFHKSKGTKGVSKEFLFYYLTANAIAQLANQRNINRRMYNFQFNYKVNANYFKNELITLSLNPTAYAFSRYSSLNQSNKFGNLTSSFFPLNKLSVGMGLALESGAQIKLNEKIFINLSPRIHFAELNMTRKNDTNPQILRKDQVTYEIGTSFIPSYFIGLGLGFHLN